MTEPTPAARLIEAVLFAAAHPVAEEDLAQRLPEGTELAPVLAEIASLYEGRGVALTKTSGKWAFRTAPDLAAALNPEQTVQRKLSRAAIETLAIIAYHQPITRAEVEQVRGVALSKGTLDMLMEATWIKPKGRRQAPGRPVTWVTTDEFLEHFGLDRIEDLPNLDELRAAGLLDHRPGITMAMRQEEADAVEAETEKERDEEDARTREERRQAQLDDDEDEAQAEKAAATGAEGDPDDDDDDDDDDSDEDDEDVDDEDDEDGSEDDEDEDDESEVEDDQSDGEEKDTPPKRSTAE